jgi:hypothetical protein
LAIGLWINLANTIDGKKLDVKTSNIGKHISLSNDPIEICIFFGLDYEIWKKGFDSKIQIFEWITSSKYFIKEIFYVENGSDRRRMESRQLYIDFMKWLWGDSEIPTEHKQSEIHIQYCAITYFNKQKELDTIIDEVKLCESRKAKYNGKLFMNHGINQKAILRKMNEFEKYVETLYKIDFNNWLDSASELTVQTQINLFFLSYVD